MKLISSNVYAGNDAQLITHFSDSVYLETVGCGLIDLTKSRARYVCQRPNGSKNYMIQILTQGKGYHVIDGKTEQLKANQFMLYEPDRPHDILHYGTDNPIFWWLHFTGYKAADIVDELKLLGKNTILASTSVKNLMMKLILEHKRDYPGNELLCQSILLELLVELSRKTVVGSKEPTSTDSYYDKISPAVNHMVTHYYENLTILQYAQMCSLSESRFSHIFKEVTGSTATKYLEKIRISNSKELLKNSALSISSIAKVVGYSDQYYFSRVFKHAENMPPLTYRNKTKL